MSWLSDVATIAGAVLILLGAVFTAIAAFGVLRLPDALGRMHTASKPQTLGIAMLAVGLALELQQPAATGMLLLVAFLQLLTAPVASQMIARSAYRARQYRRDLIVEDETAD
jgi:multicomponent Na+:H+ antiporter subunit G